MIKFLDLQKVTQKHGEEIHEAAARVVDSGWYLQGVENRRFEQDYADFIGTRHCIGCANGLDALVLIFRAYIEMGVMKPGDEVIVPANTYIASILALTENCLTPVLVEPSYDTLEIDPEEIERHITPRTRAIFIVHLYGRCAFAGQIGDLCARYGLKLIEDNAQAHGCRCADGRRTGSIGDAAGHSFYPGKNLGALGDGGAVTTDDDVLARTVRTLANYGSSVKYVFDYCGRNSRLDELQAAVLDAKLQYLDEDNAWRQRAAAYYYGHITNPLITLPAGLPDSENVYHIFPVLCGRRDDLQKYLADNGVQTLIHYPIPPHRQKCYSAWNSLSLPVTERIHECELSIPISPVITDDEVMTVVSLINRFR